MKKKILGITLFSSVLLVGFINTTVNAEETGEAKSISDIQFRDGGENGDNDIDTSNPNPDTDDKTKPNPDPDPKDPTQPGRNGSLRFVSLPSISFGKVDLSSKDQSYYALFEERTADLDDQNEKKGEKFLYPTFLTIEDIRGGAKGWQVTVKHNGEFINTNSSAKENGTEKLRGYLSLRDANIATNTFTSEADLEAYTPKNLAANTQNFLSISENEAVTLVKADKGTGYGKWSVGYGSTTKQTTGLGIDGNQSEGKEVENRKGRNPAVKIDIPSQIIGTEDEDQYVATLEWNISQVK